MKRSFFFLWLVGFLILAVPTGGMAVSLWDSLIPPGKTKVGNVEVDYNKYPLSHYQLDLYLEEKSFWELDEQLSDTGHYFLHQITNMLWQVNVELSRVVIWMLEEALELDLVNEIGHSVGDGVQTLAGFNGSLTDRGFYGLFFPLMIVILGGWVGWKALAKGNEDAAKSGLIHAFVVIFVAFTFFYFVKDFATEANRVSGEISKGVMALASNTLQPEQSLSGEEATVQAGNNLWNLMVSTPYKLLQFGTTDVDQQRVDQILSQSPEKRGAVIEKELKEHQNQMITTKNNGTRLGFVFMVLILNLVVSCVTLLVAAGIPFYQLYFLFLMLLAPIAFTWAIIPDWKDALYKWINELLGALLMKIALGVLLALYLSISGALYQFSIEKGYFLSMFLQLVFLGLMIWKRKDIYQLVTIPSTLTTGFSNQSANLLNSMHKALGVFDSIQVPKNWIMGRRKQKKKKKNQEQKKPTSQQYEPTYIPTYMAEPKEDEKPDLIFEPYDDSALPHEEKLVLQEQHQENKPMLVFENTEKSPEPERLPDLQIVSVNREKTEYQSMLPPISQEKDNDNMESKDTPVLMVGEKSD